MAGRETNREPKPPQELSEAASPPEWKVPDDPRLYSRRFGNPESEATFQEQLPKLLKREGGYNPDVGDDAGATNRGITQDTLNNLNRKYPHWKLPKTTKELTEPQTEFIYREEFFYRPGYDRIAAIPGLREAAPNLIEQIFDIGANRSPERAGEMVQQILSEMRLGSGARDDQPALKQDGILGLESRAALAQIMKEGRLPELYGRLAQRRQDILIAAGGDKAYPGLAKRVRGFIDMGAGERKR